MGPKAAIFSHNGLGDGVNMLVLSNILHLNGWNVETYHNMMGAMQPWFPHLKMVPYPEVDAVSQVLSRYDWFFVVYNSTDPFVLKLIQEGKRRFPEKMKVIYLYVSKNIVNEPYYSDCATDPTISVVENLRRFAERVLKLPKIGKSNGLIPPAELVQRKFRKRVVIHPTSSRETRNWPKEKFVKLALHLREDGYEVVFVPGKREGWEDVEGVVLFQNLDLLARFIYESGYLIGNDSGLGHLASALGIPTLTLCRRRAWAKMWAPSFQKGVVVAPFSWIPNISGFRLRDRHWKKWITIGMARRGFETLIQKA